MTSLCYEMSLAFVHVIMLLSLSAMRELIRALFLTEWTSSPTCTGHCRSSCAFNMPWTWAPSNFYCLLFWNRGIDGLTRRKQEGEMLFLYVSVQTCSFTVTLSLDTTTTQRAELMNLPQGRIFLFSFTGCSCFNNPQKVFPLHCCCFCWALHYFGQRGPP